jgi:hypothetical protein
MVESIPEFEVMWDEAPVSKSQSKALGGVEVTDRPCSAW